MKKKQIGGFVVNKFDSNVGRGGCNLVVVLGDVVVGGGGGGVTLSCSVSPPVVLQCLDVLDNSCQN